ncbi:MAG: ShlB/FhaC/HecB family hemolysin secretion/activation protein [Candidatus Caenarcaniphilales bacterium]|nr:ShlB/FhaC/HecB family hemolysin secretion/activation protein [Candidatus Caenarcaniphilales bacterium]
MIKNIQFVAFFSLSLFIFQNPVFSQVTTPLLPSQVSPGAVIQPSQVQDYKDPSKLKKKPKQKVEEQEKKEEVKKVKSKTKINLSKIVVLDNTLISPFLIDKVTKKYINREVDFNDLQELTLELSALYRDKGYVTSRVYLPPQRVENGLLTLQSSEGIIKPITLQEGKYYKSKSIFPRLRIDQNEHLNINKIKSDLARINENPDVGLQAVLKPGKETGTTEVLLQTKDRLPIHFSPFFDNLGRDLIGNERFGFGITHNNLLGFGDTNVTSLNWTKESFGVSNNYEMPIGKYGTKVGFNYAHSRLELGKQFAPLNVEGFATIYTPYISQEIYRGKHLQANADLALDFKNLGTDILGTRFSRDRLRIIRPGLNVDEFDKYGRTFLRNELAFGVDPFNETNKYSPINSRAGSGDGFFRYTVFGTRITQLPHGIQHILRGTGQFSDDLLNSAEQMQVGGAFTVRGYKEGQLIGDSGFVLSQELRVPTYIFPRSWKFPMTRDGIPAIFSKKGKKQPLYDYVFRDNIQVVGFTDFGGAFVNPNKLIGVPGSDNFAIGVGSGLRVRLTRFLVGRVDVGVPLIRNLPERHDLFVHFGLQSEPF